MVLQAKVNGMFGAASGTGIMAGEVTSVTGALLLAPLLLLPSSKAGISGLVAGLRAGRIQWWMLLAGMSGGFYVITQGTAAGLLGLSFFLWQ
jgi:bacterial/archaeal transporter family-2 protein